MRDAIKGFICGMAMMAVLYILHYMVAYDPMRGFELRVGTIILLIVLIIAIATDNGKSKQARVLKARSLRRFHHWVHIATDDDNSESPLRDTKDADRYFGDGWLEGYQAGQESRHGEILGAAIGFSFIGMIVAVVIYVVLNWLFG
jgi:hypothetical protein